MIPRAAAALWGIACVTSAAAAGAQPPPPPPDGCPREAAAGMPDGPAQVGLLDGGLGVPHRLCPRTEVGLGAGALVVADFADFYGHVLLAGVAAFSWTPGDERTELFASLEAVRFQTVISSIDAAELGLGHLSLGGARTLIAQHEWRVGASARLVLPTATALYENVWPLALDLIAEIEWQASRLLRVHGHAGGLGSMGIGSGPTAPEAAVVAGGGAAVRPLDWLAVVAGVETSFGRTAALDHLAVTGALRFGVGEAFGAELAALFPLAGRERAVAAAALRATWRL